MLAPSACKERPPDDQLARTRGAIAAEVGASEFRCPRDDRRIADEARRFYAGRQHDPAWQSSGAVDSLRRAIDESVTHGLDPAAYSVLQGADDDDVARIARDDVSRTCAFLTLASDHLGGRAPEAQWQMRRSSADLVALLARAVTEEDPQKVIAELAPMHEGYERLRTVLALHREIAARGGWPAVAENAAPEVLRDRLSASGDLDRATSGDAEAVTNALRRFQARHGIEPDGKPSERTVRALSVPVADRIRQVEVNLERWRWLPADLGARYVLVNVPAAALEAVENRTAVLQMRVVVGKRYNPTPVFMDTMTSIVLNPYWQIPPSIVTDELVPEIRRDPGLLDRRGIEILQKTGTDASAVDPASINWTTIDPASFPFRLRQRPGPRNALGRIKFLFPNHHAVYLHDTPERKLFGRNDRLLSHGCIRVEKPLELGEFVLHDPRWTRQDVAAAIETGERKTIQLREPLPVYIFYFTTWAASDGSLQVRDDVYSHDDAVGETLAAARP